MINPFKTLWVNFRYLPIRTALSFPLLMHFHSKLRVAKNGKIIIPPKFGLLRIGSRGSRMVDSLFERTFVEVDGTLEVSAQTYIGVGSKVIVYQYGILKMKGVNISSRTTILCHKDISIGKGSLLSWDILLMDSDFHPIFNVTDSNKQILNPAGYIHIGERVWIGCRTTILKNVEIAKDTIIASGSMITKNLEEEKCIYGGINRIIKKNIYWKDCL